MKVLFVFSVFAVLVCMPALSYPDVKVMLTSGREIIADTCEEEGGRLICTKMEGTFEIEKKDVVSVREIKGERNEPLSAEPSSAVPGEPENKTDVPGSDNSPDKATPPAGGQPEAMKRLEQIAQKKKELSSDRSGLVKEREQLEGDLKKAPDWMPVKQYEELTRRNAKLDEKIKLFNEEVRKLDEEEKQIVEGLRKKD